ncbi:penicillin acylase family protein [Methylomagnum sp.]
MTRKHTLYVLGFALLALIAPVTYQIDRAAQSLPKLDGEARLPGLAAPVAVEFDNLAIPTVTAQNREDAHRALGLLHARDRLFQMDLMRRKSAGRLAEIFGAKALPVDQTQRAYQFEPAARAIVAHLPPEQRRALDAYTAGINQHITTAKEVPPEFRALHYRPEPWRPEDSLLVALGMFQTLGAQEEQDERMLTVMARTLPPEVVAFLTPDSDEYTRALLGGPDSRRPAQPVPAQAITQLIGESDGQRLSLAAVREEPAPIGSNNWAVNATKTADGRAIVADDMHLPLGVPNVWYRARLNYAGLDVSGVTLPGVPLIVVGSNGHVAWGFTNIEGDYLDLVKLDINPANPAEYRAPDGWRRFETHAETIAVKDGSPVTAEVKSTVWGPVSPEPLLGEAVALHWAALDPQAVNLGLMDMDAAATLETAMAVLNRAGTPPQNALLADERGRIGWTYMGFIPRRTGLDGSVSRSWADGAADWNGYIPPDELPRLIDPPEGYLATANNRTLGKAYPYVVGHGFANGYRAHRIGERLAAKAKLTEQDLLDVQLDTTSEFYEFYRRLALEILAGETDPELADAAEAIQHWNGKLDPDSLGVGLLVRWRGDLAKAVFAPLVSRCAQAEPGFAYQWRKQETPLRALLSQRLPDTLPDRRQGDWRTFLRATLRQSVAELQREHEGARLSGLPWGKVNVVRVQHPFSRAVPVAGWLLDMPETPGACNGFCVKVLHGLHGGSERLVVSPNHPGDGILHMPGGQSGHPFSPHYRDQQPAWVAGKPLPFLPGKAEHKLSLTPG